jgi:hypothetical protein
MCKHYWGQKRTRSERTFTLCTMHAWYTTMGAKEDFRPPIAVACILQAGAKLGEILQVAKAARQISKTSFLHHYIIMMSAAQA